MSDTPFDSLPPVSGLVEKLKETGQRTKQLQASIPVWNGAQSGQATVPATPPTAPSGG